MPLKGHEIPIGERLERYSMPVTETGCWLWIGGCETRGFPFLRYGRIWVKGRTLVAHRVSYEHHIGPVPTGMKVLHKCDVPLCVNPAHLMLGTSRDNTHDMISKGRNEPMLSTRRGASSNFAKLTAQQVLAIRSDNRFQRVIAKEYQITQTAVSSIKLRKSWSHI